MRRDMSEGRGGDGRGFDSVDGSGDDDGNKMMMEWG